MIGILDMKLEANIDFIGIINQLSSLASNIIPIHQTNSILETILSEIAKSYKADYAFISFKLTSRYVETVRFARSYGLSLDAVKSLNKYIEYEETEINNLNTNFQYVYNISHDMGKKKRYLNTAETLGVKQILSVPILGIDRNLGVINLYFRKQFEIPSSTIGSLHAISELLANIYANRHAFNMLLTDERIRSDYFYLSNNHNLILDSKFKIVDFNENAANFFNYRSENAIKTFLDLVVDEEEKELVKRTANSLQVGDRSEEVMIRLSTIDKNLKAELQELQKSYIFTFKKAIDENKNEIFISTGRETQTHTEDVTARYGNTDAIIPKLIEFKQLYQINPKKALKLAKEDFFTAAYAFALNEITGPIPLAGSPDKSLYAVMQEGVNLMAGLNTEAILSEGYIHGVSPWGATEGDFNWIAFPIKNDKARGKVEIHVLGIVIRQNLTTAKENLIRPLLGILLGAMNTYISIILEDSADFITSRYNNDRHFGTIEDIKDHLDEVRNTCADILGAYSRGPGKY